MQADLICFENNNSSSKCKIMKLVNFRVEYNKIITCDFEEDFENEFFNFAFKQKDFLFIDNERILTSCLNLKFITLENILFMEALIYNNYVLKEGKIFLKESCHSYKELLKIIEHEKTLEKKKQKKKNFFCSF